MSITFIERQTERLLKSLREIVGLHPEIQSSYRPGWTGELPPDVEPIEPFKAKPAKRRRKVA